MVVTIQKGSTNNQVWTRSAVLNALQCEKDTIELISWLSSSTAPAAAAAADGTGATRVEVSLFVANGIREGCRTIPSPNSLQLPAAVNNNTSCISAVEAEEAANATTARLYNDEAHFPSLPNSSSSTNNNVDNTTVTSNPTPSNHNSNSRFKRRIRPAQITQQQHQPSTGDHTSTKSTTTTSSRPNPPTIASLPSEQNVDDMMRRQIISQKKKQQQQQQQQQQKPTPIKKESSNVWITTNSTTIKPKNTTNSITSSKIPTIATTTNINTTAPSSSSISMGTPDKTQLQQTIVVRLAQLYSCIIIHKLVPSTILELQLCIRLLFFIPASPPDDSTSTDTSATPTTTPTATSTTTNNKDLSFLSILHSQWKVFASHVLSMLCQPILIHLGHDLCRSMSDIIHMATTTTATSHENSLLLKVHRQLQSILETQQLQFLHTDLQDKLQIGATSSLSSPNTTLPFDPKRDSRHQFRTQEQSSYYKHREETRDAFLSLLRSFQQHQYQLQQQQSHHIGYHQLEFYKKFRLSSKSILEKVLQDNTVFWFVDFFTQLLLQIGWTTTAAASVSTSVTKEETEVDEELLQKIGSIDPERLQKLHQRIISNDNKNKYSKKPFFANNSSKLQYGTETEESKQENEVDGPVSMFPGTMEFFYLFIQTADSYTFSCNLRNRLLGELHTSISSDTKHHQGIVQRIWNKKLLAKFLGLLEFSSRYHPSHNNIMIIRNSYTEHVAKPQSLDSPHHYYSEVVQTMNTSNNTIIPLKSYILHAWKNHSLISTIPWVIDFLWMAKWWDQSFVEPSHYYYLVCLLRSIQKHVGQTRVASSASNPNLQLVDLMMEMFFATVIGLTQAENLPQVPLPNRISNFSAVEMKGDTNNNPLILLDDCPIWFGTAFLFHSCYHLEDLSSLIAEVKSSFRHRKSGGTLKKMRPMTLSTDLSVTSSMMMGGMLLNNSNNKSLKSGSSSSVLGTAMKQQQIEMQSRLVDSFFHQHRQLKVLVDFVVDTVVKHASAKVVEFCDVIILKTLDSLLEENDDVQIESLQSEECEVYKILLLKTEEKIRRKADAWLHVCCCNNLKDAIVALSPPDIDPNVQNVAVSLASKHAFQEGKQFVQTLLETSLKMKINCEVERKTALSRKQRKASPKMLSCSSVEHKLLSITKVIRDISSHGKKWRELSFYDENQYLHFSRQIFREISFQNTKLTISEDILDSFVSSMNILQNLWLNQFQDLIPQENLVQISPGVFSLWEIALSLGSKGIISAGLHEFGSTFLRPHNILVLVNHTHLDKHIFYWNSDQQTSAPEGHIDKCDIEAKACLFVKLIVSNLVTSTEVENSFLHLLGQNHHKVESVAKEIVLLVTFGNEEERTKISNIQMRKLGKAVSAKCVLDRCASVPFKPTN